jgi:hypothetical protein
MTKGFRIAWLTLLAITVLVPMLSWMHMECLIGPILLLTLPVYGYIFYLAFYWKDMCPSCERGWARILSDSRVTSHTKHYVWRCKYCGHTWQTDVTRYPNPSPTRYPSPIDFSSRSGSGGNTPQPTFKFNYPEPTPPPRKVWCVGDNDHGPHWADPHPCCPSEPLHLR